MYQYNALDRQFVAERVAQFRQQTARYLAGELTEEEFRPLRLQNGLYTQRHGPMLRIAIPYGALSARQLRTLAQITRDYDRGWGHFSTRSNLQLNWPELARVPDILAALAEVDMHAIQTSGNCVRNITVDPFAGVSHREIDDPRPWAEILRQWAALHPEFSALPRKFKFAVSGGPDDGAGTLVHDLGFRLTRAADGALGFVVSAGGGLGRTPIVGQIVREFLPWQHMLTYAEAVLRIYNLYGRRDNLFKARIKILVKALGVAEFARTVEEEWAYLVDGPQTLTESEVARVREHFLPPAYSAQPPAPSIYHAALAKDAAFRAWCAHNVHAHKIAGYAAVTLSLKSPQRPPGDATAEQMEAAADFSERYGFGEIRSTQTQNLLLPDVRITDLYALWQEAHAAELATTGVGLIGDVTCCPGGDLCALANARSHVVAQSILQRFSDYAEQADIGKLKLNISGCINACSHHHVGAIGILGVDKQGEEFYQITLGGNYGGVYSNPNDANSPDTAYPTTIGKIIGPAFAREEVAAAVSRIVDAYQERRLPHELFVDALRRLGIEPFRAAAYARPIPAVQVPEAELAYG